IEALVGPVVYRQSVADLAGTWLADFELVVVHLGLDPEERARYDADNRVFREVNRQFRGMYPHGTWQEFVSSASQSREGRNALAPGGAAGGCLGSRMPRRVFDNSFRPPIAQDRLTVRPDGTLEPALKSVSKDGTRSV